MRALKEALFKAFNLGEKAFIILYGTRGSGKTTLLTQLAMWYERPSILLFYRENDVIVSTLLEKYKHQEKNITVKFVKRFQPLNEYINVVVEVISEGITKEKPLICTDILSPEILLRPFESEEEVFLFGKLITLLFMISTIGTLILEIEENPRSMLPYRWFALVELADKFILIRKGHRLRVLYEVQLKLPEVGQKWNHEKIWKTLSLRRLLFLALEKEYGFRPMVSKKQKF